MACLTADELAAFLRGRLPVDREAAATEHLGSCDLCAERISRVDLQPKPAESTSGSSSGGFPQDAAAARPALVRGDAIGRYLILDAIAEGGMGAVYAAYDPELSRKVAIKLLRPNYAGKSRAQAQLRLQREAQAMARISHPNVLPVYDVGTHGDSVFLAMELAEHGSLKNWLAEAHGWREVLTLFMQAGRGLAAAHAAGLVHRDFKPANVLIGADGRARVTDFGIARLADSHEAALPTDLSPTAFDEQLTRDGAVLGTPRFMSPEQHLGKPADARSDQFSFCVALYLGLFGRPPFEPQRLRFEAVQAAAAETRSLRSSTSGRARPLLVAEPPRDSQVPAFVRRVLWRGLSLDPSERFPSMDALLAELDGDPALRRQRLVLAGAAVVMVASLGVVSLRAFGPDDALCSGGAARLSADWNENHAQRLAAAFQSTGHPEAAARARATAQFLDEYTAAWSTQFRDSCVATRVHREQTEAQMTLQMGCLEQRRKELGALVRTLLSADEKLVERGADAVAALPSVRPCSDVEALTQKPPLPDDPELRDRVEAVQGELSEINALRAAARYASALARAEEAAKRAEAIQYRPLQAEAQHLLGWLQDATGKWQEGERSLIRAVWVSEAARDDRLRVQAATKLVFNLSRQSRFAEAWDWTGWAEAAIERLGGDDELRADLLQHRALLKMAQHRSAEALPDFEEALRLTERLFPARHPRRAFLLTNLGALQLQLRELSAAERTLGEALSLIEALRGPQHVSAASIHSSLAGVFIELGRSPEAERHARLALEIRRKSLGGDHPSVADALDVLASVHARAKQPELALAAFRESAMMKERLLGAEHPDLAYSLLGMADVLNELRSYREAISVSERAARLAAATPVLAALSRFQLARARMGLGDVERGRRMAEEIAGSLEQQGMTAEAEEIRASLEDRERKTD